MFHVFFEALFFSIGDMIADIDFSGLLQTQRLFGAKKNQ